MNITLRGYQSADPFEFIASTEAVDRYGDIVDSAGWDLKNFKKNPIALWQHNSTSPIGVWENVRVEGGKLIARLAMVKAGVSSIADMVRGMIEQRVLRAVSVGFIPKKWEPIDEADPRAGVRYTKSELVEISVVSVPANPEALSVAKALGATEETLKALFPTRPSAVRQPSAPTGKKSMPTLAERIAARQAEIATKKDQLTELSVKEEHTDEESVQIDTLSQEIEASTKSLETLLRAQTALAASAVPAGHDKPGEEEKEERAAPPVKKTGLGKSAIVHARSQKDPASLMFRSAIVAIRSYVERRSPEELIRNHYQGSQELEAVVRAVTDPAMTSVTGWAAELVGNTTGAFVDILRPNSIFFQLPIPTFTFGRGKLKLPGRSGGSLAGDFVGEAAPIPVKQLSLSSTTLEPYKLGVITPFTREIAALSDPAIEPLLRDIMIADTRDTIDGLFLDATAAVPGVRPAGLQNLATGNTVASSGTTLANVITDLRAALAAMTTNNMGKNLVWIMNVQRVLSLSLMTNAAGSFMFRDEVGQGTLLGLPLFASTKVPASVVFLMDAAEFAAAYDTVPQIDVSEQATLHMEGDIAEVAPIVDGTMAAPVPAAPVRSLFQTATIALRLLWDMTWAMRRAKAVFTITGVAW